MRTTGMTRPPVWERAMSCRIDPVGAAGEREQQRVGSPRVRPAADHIGGEEHHPSVLDDSVGRLRKGQHLAWRNHKQIAVDHGPCAVVDQEAAAGAMCVQQDQEVVRMRLRAG